MGAPNVKADRADARSGRTMGRWSWLVFFALVVTLYPKTSTAAPNDIRVGQASRLRVDGAPRVTLTSEVSCPTDPDACAVSLHWTIPGAEHPRNAVFFLAAGQIQSVIVGGTPAEAAIDHVATSRPTRLDIVLPASAQPLQLEIAATIRFHNVGPSCGFAMTFDFAEQRHFSQPRAAIDVDIDGAPPVDSHVDRTLQRADDPPAVEYSEPPNVSFTVPRSWKISRTTWSSERGAQEQVATPREPGKLRLHAETHRVVHGPVVAVGARIRNKDARPWLRGGWEFSVVPRLLHTLAVESDLRGFTVVPSTEIGTGGWYLLPAVSVGVGVPVRVLPHVRPGARLWGGLNFPFVGVVGGYDVFPAMGRSPLERVGHVGLQFSI